MWEAGVRIYGTPGVPITPLLYQNFSLYYYTTFKHMFKKEITIIGYF